MGIKFANNALSRLASSISNSDVTLSVAPGDGAKFPSLTPGDYFLATIVNATGSLEIVKVTARTTDTFTVERGQEGTTPQSFNAGDAIQLRMTVGAFKQAVEEEVSDKLDKNGGTASGLKFSVSDLGSVSGSVSIDLSAAQEFASTITGNTTFSFSNAPAAGQSQVVYLRLTNAGAYTITWPAGTKFDSGSAPDLTASGVDLIGVKYDPATSTYMVFVIGLDVKVP